MKLRKPHLISIPFFILLFILSGCLKEHLEIVPQLEGVPAGGMTNLQVKSVDGDLIEIEMTLFVVDHFGSFISGLTTDNFYISGIQNDIEFKISELLEFNDEERGPFSSTLLFDQSGSINTTDPLDARIEAGTSFAKLVSGGDEASVVAFTTSGNYQSPYEILTGFSNNSADLVPVIESLSGKADGGTPLYQSIFGLTPYTADNGKNDNRAIIAFTDGDDTEGSVTINNIIQQACARKVRLYTVGLGSGIDSDVLSKMAFETGGAVMLAEDALQLVSLYNSLGELLHGKARFYRIIMQFKRGVGNWLVGNQVQGSLSLPLSETLTINFPFQSSITTRQAGEWYERMPDCPCSYEEAQYLASSECDDGTWLDCGAASQKFHYGATWEVRWTPDKSGDPGQQCTYNIDKELITKGIAAGSPDKVSPESCGFPTTSTSKHYLEDVLPWENNLIGGVIVDNKTCTEYLQEWPANNGNGCSEKSITGIQHMLVMIEGMTCEDVTTLFRIADNTSSINPDLKSYIHGTLNYTPSNLIELLTELQGLADCDEFDCDVIETAIENLE